MNQFGLHFRLSLFGESHGPRLGITLDGVPAGIPLEEEDFMEAINRRKPSAPGTTPRKESDRPQLVSGWFNGYTTGAPLTLLFENRAARPQDYEAMRNTPRPGHADFVLDQKFNGYQDYRGGGHSSGRLTLLLVAAGVVARKILPPLTIQSQVLEAGGNPDIEAAVSQALEKQDSLGGLVECRIQGLPVGWGEPFFDSAESLIAHLAFAIPAIKGIEFGSGFSAAKSWGSKHNDALLDGSGKTRTNQAGGINGGITNGNELVFRLAVKPASSTPQPQQTWNRKENQVSEFRATGRHDLCLFLRVPVVAEAIAALAMAELYQASQARKNRPRLDA